MSECVCIRNPEKKMVYYSDVFINLTRLNCDVLRIKRYPLKLAIS